MIVSSGGVMYRTEQALVDDFVEFLSADDQWAISGYVCEFDYSSGRTDVVAARGESEIIAFEAKLVSWRGALAQAYRNKCFAHRSYVVLPTSAAGRALRFVAEFRRRGVGICVVSASGLVKLVESESAKPCLDWLSKRALDVAAGEGREEPDEHR